MLTENKHRFKIFVDFDGTITTQDVGEQLFLRYTDADKAREIIKHWIDGDINSRQTWESLCDLLPPLERDELNAFIDGMEIDATFPDFVNFCKENGHELFVLSDGLDYYIKRILARYGLADLKVYSNVAEFVDNKIVPRFPYTDEECDRCGNCKRNHVIMNSGDDEITVYIGDGYSDTCPAQFTDFIFAKKSLLKFCEVNRISYYPFSDFSDVRRRLEELSRRKRIRKRHQAQLNRRAVYLQG